MEHPFLSQPFFFHVPFAVQELLDEDGLSLLAHGLRFDLSVKQPLLICGPSGYQQPMLQLLLGMNRSTMMPRQTLMLVSKEPYVPGHCRLLAQLAYPVQLRLPSHAPFTVQVPLLHEHISEVELRQHFARLGASSCQVVVEGGDRKGLVHFSTFEDTIKAVARPQDRVIGGTELQCEIAGESSESPQLHRMRQCLIATQIDHLLTREADGWFARRSWPDVLTRDEQQRLGIARVLYQQPSFCVLEDRVGGYFPLDFKAKYLAPNNIANYKHCMLVSLFIGCWLAFFLGGG